MRRRGFRVVTCWIFFSAAIALGVAGCDKPEPTIPGNRPQLRLITQEQYRNIIGDVFGQQISVAGTFAPILREEALVATSAGHATVSASSLDNYRQLAEGIAAQVVDTKNRKLLIPCAPKDEKLPDDACAKEFLERTARLLYRRPPTEQDVAAGVAAAHTASETLGNFFDGLAFGLTVQLVSPKFLFIADSLKNASPPELDGYAKASRLSFFLWNTAPDQQLLEAAANGALDSREGLGREVDRLLSSPRLERGVRAFFSDMLALDKFGNLSKDTLIYPAFDPDVTQDAREQLLRTIVHHLLEGNADYRSLFTTRTTYMTPLLGRIYRVPVTTPVGWSRYEFPQTDARIGLQTLAGFVSLYAHPGRSSPTIRGRAVRELLLCQKVPDPPGDVDFTLFNQPSAASLVARERLKMHSTNAACAGCHKLTDEIGLALENFDGAGQYRSREASVPIDVSGSLDGVAFHDTHGLATALHDNPSLPMCLVQRAASYALAGSGSVTSGPWLNYLGRRFQDSDYKLKPLLRTIAESPNFYALAPPSDRTARDEATAKDVIK